VAQRIISVMCRIELAGIGLLHGVGQDDWCTVVRFRDLEAREIGTDRSAIPEHRIRLGQNPVDPSGGAGGANAGSVRGLCMNGLDDGETAVGSDASTYTWRPLGRPRRSLRKHADWRDNRGMLTERRVILCVVAKFILSGDAHIGQRIIRHLQRSPGTGRAGRQPRIMAVQPRSSAPARRLWRTPGSGARDRYSTLCT
jgi:hypothetical protein